MNLADENQIILDELLLEVLETRDEQGNVTVESEMLQKINELLVKLPREEYMSE